ncbi:hypothetical protein [Nitrospira sp. KM1]|uniref:hypothetical protein n=1 Tax=Nitrospira sp. KM1 TaxID=1936990 RepID=UPI001566152E|nr:hypothetical protein [Nitrospira sp. KM1]
MAAIASVCLPGLGQVLQRRFLDGTATLLLSGVLIAGSLSLGRISGRAAEVFFFMILALPWWVFQTYDAWLGPPSHGFGWSRTWRTVWRAGHDIRFLGFLLFVSALNDTYIILANLDYSMPFYCTKPAGALGFFPKALSPALHMAVGYGFMKHRRWSLFLYFVYAAYGFTNGMVNLTCFGPGRIRNTLLVAIIVSTLYVWWRRRILLTNRED